ncbi:MAG: cation diffusion facilitator family transporter [Candidatus Zixiibacteriota bacterium]
MLAKLNTPMASTRFSLVMNILLFILKIFAGLVGKSQALVADALNSLLDIVANIIVWFGIKLAKKPPDKDHPYGHGNADNIAAVMVAVILFVTGAYIGREAVHSIINGEFSKPTYLATIAAVITIVVKESLYQYTIRIGRKFKSPGVIANAYDHRSDVIVSAGTLIGIIIAQTKYPILDPIAGLWVAGFILKQGIHILRENYQTLMSGSPGADYETEVKEFILKQNGVSGVVFVKARIVGSGHYIDAAVMVDRNISVFAGHEIAESVRSAVNNNFADIIDTLIHIEPNKI